MTLTSLLAIILELDFALEFFRKLISFFLKRFWTYLKAIKLQQIIRTNKSSIKSESEKIIVTKSSLKLEFYHYVSVNPKFIRQHQLYHTLLFEVKTHLISIIFIIVNFGLAQAIDLIDLKIWLIQSITKTASDWYVIYCYLFKILYLW